MGVPLWTEIPTSLVHTHAVAADSPDAATALQTVVAWGRGAAPPQSGGPDVHQWWQPRLSIAAMAALAAAAAAVSSVATIRDAVRGGVAAGTEETAMAVWALPLASHVAAGAATLDAGTRLVGWATGPDEPQSCAPSASRRRSCFALTSRGCSSMAGAGVWRDRVGVRRRCRACRGSAAVSSLLVTGSANLPSLLRFAY